MKPAFVFCVSSRSIAVFWNRILCSDITGGKECKNGRLDVREISDVNGGKECNVGQLGVWEIKTGHQEVTHGVVAETTLKRVVENSVMSWVTSFEHYDALGALHLYGCGKE